MEHLLNCFLAVLGKPKWRVARSLLSALFSALGGIALSAPLALAAQDQNAETALTISAAPAQTPVIAIRAEFTEHTRYAVFQPNEQPVLWIQVTGVRTGPVHTEPTVADHLLWQVKDYRGNVCASGKFVVPVGEKPVEERLALGNYGAGNFEVYLRMERSEFELPAMGSRPAGFVAYSVLPDIKPLQIASIDMGRFGAQGTNFVESGKWMQGDSLCPVYPLTGLKWVYFGRRLSELAGQGPESFKPILDPAEHAKRPGYEAKNNICPFVDAHSVPAWLIKTPESAKSGGKLLPTANLQAYPPADWAAYGKLMGQVAAEQVARRKALFPQLANNYYEIHWEPDWHWKGTDEEFIQMYEVAHKAIHENDPDGLLLGANYGVLATGNRHLERLFAKGLGKYLDGIVTHIYYIPLNQTPENGGVVRDMRRLREMTAQYLPKGAPIIMSEWGVSDLRRIPKRQETAWFMRGHLATLGEGARTTFFFYTADMGESGGLFYNLTTPYPVFGATHIAPKLLFSTCAAATRLLEGTTNLGALEYLAPEVLGYAFNRGGTPLLVLWTTRGREKAITLPWSGGDAIQYDPVGNPAVVKPQNGALRVTISDIPSYVLGGVFRDLPASDDARPVVSARPGQPLVLPAELLAEAKRFRLWSDGTAAPLGADRLLPRGFRPGALLLQALGESDDKPVLASWRAETLPAAELKTIEGKRGELLIENKLAEETKGVLTLRSADQELTRRELTIPANDQQSVSLGFDKLKLPSTAASVLTADWLDSQNVACSLTLPPAQPVWPAHRSPQGPNVDGELNGDGWDLELFQTIDQPGAVKIGANEWRGAADLSFRMAIRYDASALSLAFKVRDDDHMFHQNREPWESDSIQIGLATDPDNAQQPGMQKLCFAFDPRTGKVRIWRHEGAQWQRGELSADGAIRCAVRRDGDETRYEISIPWSEIGIGWTSPPAGGQIGIGVFVNDVDLIEGKAGKRKAMEAFGGMGWTKADEFGRLTFEPDTILQR